MPRIKQTTVYQFDELSDRAKEKARDWYRSGIGNDTFWSEFVIEDFGEVLKACGFDVSTARGRNSEPAIYWELNPDSAGFDASWNAGRVNVAPLIADRPVSYKDSDGTVKPCEGNARLVPILERMQQFATDRRESYGSVGTSRRGASIGETEWHDYTCDSMGCDCAESAETFRELCADLADYLARSLSDEWDYQNSDECVDENIRINEYEFEEDGSRA